MFGALRYGGVSLSCCAAAEGRLSQALHAVTASTAASSLKREPGGRIAGIARNDKNLSAEDFLLLHESYGTWLPREGAAERLKELTKDRSVARQRDYPHGQTYEHRERRGASPSAAEDIPTT